jgi:isocitrate/isopropylmalate dehydrogenase
VVRKRLGRQEQKNSESVTSLSDLGKKQKVRSRNYTKSIAGRLPGDSLDPPIQNTLPLTRNSGQTLKIPPGKLKKQLEQVLSQVRKTRSSLTKFETIREAKEFEAELKKYLPKNIGVFIIRETEVNCYQIIYREKEDKQLEERRIKQFQRAFINRLKVDQDIQHEIKRAEQRAYFAKKNKADKRKKEAQEFERTEKAKNTRPKRRS